MVVQERQGRLLDNVSRLVKNKISVFVEGALVEMREESVFEKIESLFQAIVSDKNFPTYETQRFNNSQKLVDAAIEVFRQSNKSPVAYIRRWEEDVNGPSYPFAKYICQKFRDSLHFRPHLVKGTDIKLREEYFESLRKLDKKVFQYPGCEYVVSNVFGEYVLVKNRDLSIVSNIWLHAHRFKLKNGKMIVKRLIENEKDLKHRFTEATWVPDVLTINSTAYSVKNSLAARIVSINHLNGYIYVAPYESGLGFRREASFLKKIDDYREKKEHTFAPDGYGMDMRIGDTALIFDNRIAEIMRDAGWPAKSDGTTDDMLAWNYWSYVIRNSIAKIKEIIEEGDYVVVNFVPSARIDMPQNFGSFDFKIKPINLMSVSPEEAHEFCFKGFLGDKQGAQGGLYTVTSGGGLVPVAPLGPTRAELEKLEKERVEREELEQDIAGGPYPVVNEYLGKIIQFKAGWRNELTDKFAYVKSVNEQNGRMDIYTYSHRSKEHWYLRVSQGVLNHIDIIGDRIYAD